MPAYNISVPRATDREVISFFFELIKVTGGENFSVSIAGYHKQIIFTNDSHQEDLEIYNDTSAITSAYADKNSYNVNYSRGSINGNPTIYFDSLTINSPDHGSSNAWRPDQGVALHINSLIEKFFKSKSEHSSFLFRDSNAFEQVIASHQLILSRLESSLATVGDKLVSERIKIENEFREARSDVEKKFRDSKELLDNEHKGRLEKLSLAEEELERRRKELDDRDNTHARRQIRADLKKRIGDHSQSFGLTSGTRTLRLPIHLLTWLSLGALGFAAYYFSVDINKMVAEAAANDKAIGAAEVVVLALKPLALTVAFLGLLTWYLRWMNRWFERHAEAEFQLKQFELDVDRASWVVETALEWRQEQQAPMPDPLLEGISRNLFSRSEKDEGADMHPADYLASALLGRASGLRLKLPNAEVEFDGKAMKEAKQTAEKAKP